MAKRMKIIGGILCDGTGAPRYPGELLLENGKIQQVGKGAGSLAAVAAEAVLDAKGMVITPGFVDIHRHCDAKPLQSPAFGDVLLCQGITTTVVGNCGISLTPCPTEPAQARAMYDFYEAVLGPVAPDTVKTYPAYVQDLEKAALPVNFAAMIGTGAVKITVKGFSDTPFTEAEKAQARALLEQAMQLGAPGASMGIMYLPECYSTAEEFAEILEPVGRYGGVLTAHIRGEGDSLLDSVQEAIRIARLAGCALEISHFKSCGLQNWQRDIHRAIEQIEAARAAGQDVTCDFYPYIGGSTALTTMLPPPFVAGDMQAALEKLGTPQGVEAFRRDVSQNWDGWDNYAISLGWARILISGVVLEENRKFLGMDMVTAADVYGYPDAVALAAHLMHSEKGKTAIINLSMCQEDVDTVARLPYAHVISDAIYADTDTPHPRLYGAFPKILREYVRERGVLTLEEAVHKMTDQPARRMKLTGRGRLQAGYYADLNIFDPAQFRDRATFENPAQLSVGLSLCMVNGEIVLQNGQVQCRSAGRLLKRG